MNLNVIDASCKGCGVCSQVCPENAFTMVDKSKVNDTDFLPQSVATPLLKAYGIPAPEIELARSPEEAIHLARQLGFPVAIKVASPDIAHKSDVGGVMLGLENSEAVSTGFSKIVQQSQKNLCRQEIRDHLLNIEQYPHQNLKSYLFLF